ncbi:MAG: caspase family protein [Caldimonas sp.]
MTSRRRLVQLAASMTLADAPLAALAKVVASPASRVALVIGNERYRHNPLHNAANDARGMAALLTQAGFTVDLKVDATLAQMASAIDALGQAAARPDVGTVLFFYAGHAAQLDWRNYLLPVDGNVEAASDILRQCVDLGTLLRRLERARGKTKLIILDACRDDPFGPRFRPVQKGMSQYDAPAGTLLAFATAPGRVALEMAGSVNGRYTESLLRELSVRGVRIDDALKRVRLSVRLASNGTQVPWESTSLESDVYLFPAPRLSEIELEQQARDELAAWNRIKASPKPKLADWVDYLKRYPNGKFAEVAQVRMRNLMASSEATPRPALPGHAPALQLGPGLAVPQRLKGSGNPNSAGTYPFRPVWTAGDEYLFHELDLYSGVRQRSYRIVVSGVDAANNQVEFADGSLSDLTGAPLKEGRYRHYDVPIQLNPAELQVGRRWASRFSQSGGGPSGVGEYDFRISERQAVKVPAGEFSAFRIEGIGSFIGRHLRLTRWLVPGLNVALRQEVRQTVRTRVLVSAKQAVSG